MGEQLTNWRRLIGITGGAGTGKTVVLSNIAKSDILQGKSVLFCLSDFETPKSIMKRMNWFKHLPISNNKKKASIKNKSILNIGYFSDYPFYTDVNKIIEEFDEHKYDSILIDGIDSLFLGPIKNTITRTVLVEKTKPKHNYNFLFETSTKIDKEKEKESIKAMKVLMNFIEKENRFRKISPKLRIIGTLQTHKRHLHFNLQHNFGPMSHVFSDIVLLEKNSGDYSATIVKSRCDDNHSTKKIKFFFET